MGPPLQPPSEYERYRMASTISAYFSTMETSALIHIQKTEPIPPSDMATATPTIFPTPSVPASETLSTRRGEFSPAPPASIPRKVAKGCTAKKNRSYISTKIPAANMIIGSTASRHAFILERKSIFFSFFTCTRNIYMNKRAHTCRVFAFPPSNMNNLLIIEKRLDFLPIICKIYYVGTLMF